MKRLLTKEEWLQKQRKKQRVYLTVIISLFLMILVSFVFLVGTLLFAVLKPRLNTLEELRVPLKGIELELDYLTPNEYSRPQKPLKRIKGIVVHYTANPGSSAKNNRDYFNGLATKMTTYASSHYIVGLKGEIVQCIPLTEISYASNQRNKDTVSIECCHEDTTGKFNEATADSLVALTAALCIQYDLESEDIIRHYDVTGKLCPLYYVEHEEAWEDFKLAVSAKMDELKASVP